MHDVKMKKGVATAMVNAPELNTQSHDNHPRPKTQRKSYQCFIYRTDGMEQTKGIHAHFMINVPRGMQNDYKRALFAWVGIEKNRFKHKEIIYPPWDFLGYYKKAHGVRKYICKGVLKQGNKALGDIIPSFQGEIIGRRCGMNKII